MSVSDSDVLHGEPALEAAPINPRPIRRQIPFELALRSEFQRQRLRSASPLKFHLADLLHRLAVRLVLLALRIDHTPSAISPREGDEINSPDDAANSR